VNEVCLGAHRALGCSGATRSDVIVTEKGEVFILELNTLPGMTEMSLLPKIAAGRGIDFAQLCERLLLGASLKA
jgi:D-alanine-D-alanine ligase